MVAERAREIRTTQDIFDLPMIRHGDGCRWWLLGVATSTEARISALLSDVGAIKLPLVEKVRISRPNGKTRTYERSLFRNYMFCNGSPTQIWNVHDEISFGITDIPSQARTVQQLASVYELCLSQENLSAVKLEPGTRVRVLQNRPFEGKEGIITQTNGSKVWFPVDILGQMAPTEISIHDVEAID